MDRSAMPVRRTGYLLLCQLRQPRRLMATRIVLTSLSCESIHNVTAGRSFFLTQNLSASHAAT